MTLINENGSQSKLDVSNRCNSIIINKENALNVFRVRKTIRYISNDPSGQMKIKSIRIHYLSIPPLLPSLAPMQSITSHSLISHSHLILQCYWN